MLSRYASEFLSSEPEVNICLAADMKNGGTTNQLEKFWKIACYEDPSPSLITADSVHSPDQWIQSTGGEVKQRRCGKENMRFF